MRIPARLLPAAALLAAAAGCTVPLPQPVPEALPPPVIVPGECDAQAAQFALGRPYNTPLGEEMRQHAHAERVRALRPGDMVTMEFDARRLTIDLDGEGKIVRARCS